MKINRDYLPIKLHYFVRYAGTAPLTYLLPVMVRQKGLSAQTVGLLWTVLPVIGLITNSISGTLADYFRAHRSIFLGSLLALTMGITSMYWIPEIQSDEIPLNPVHNLTTSGTVASDHIFTSLNFTLNKNITTHSSVLEDYVSIIDPEMMVEEGQAPPADVMVAKARESAASRSATPFVDYFKYPQFWLVFFALMIEQMGISTCIMISDSVCFQILGSERHKYGQQRLWGTIGMGVMAIVSGALVDLYSQGLPEQDYLPAIIMCIVLMSIDLVVVARLKIPYTKGVKLRLGDVGSALIRPQVLLFLVTVYVMGTSLGVLWVFKLMTVEDVALAWDPQFPVLKLLQGLVMGIETFGGELLFLFLSGSLIKRLGHTRVLGVSIASVSLLCCLFYTVTNPWWFLPLQLLNGPSYSLFHTAMVSYASHIAPPGAQSTMQSIVRASFSFGLSTAGFIGGLLFQSLGGPLAFLTIGFGDFVYLIIFIVLQFLIMKYCSRKKMFGDSDYVEAGNSTSSGENSTDSETISEPAEEPLVDDAMTHKEKERTLMEHV